MEDGDGPCFRCGRCDDGEIGEARGGGVRLNDGVFEGLDVVADVFGLLGWDGWGWSGGLIRVAVVEADFGAERFGEGEVARGDSAACSWAEAVDLDEVASGDVFYGEVIGVESFDIDAVGTVFRFFHGGEDEEESVGWDDGGGGEAPFGALGWCVGRRCWLGRSRRCQWWKRLGCGVRSSSEGCRRRRGQCAGHRCRWRRRIR